LEGFDEDRKKDSLTMTLGTEQDIVRIVNLSHYNVDEVFSRHRASSHSTNTKLLPDEAISRKSIYGERG